MKEAKREVWLLLGSDQIVTGVHPAEWCSGSCVIHNPSDHSLRDLPLGFDARTKAFYRTCPCGSTHQDPDERIYWTNQLARASKASKARVSGSGKSLEALANEKLSQWACPLCTCGCCDITSV